MEELPRNHTKKHDRSLVLLRVFSWKIIETNSMREFYRKNLKLWRLIVLIIFPLICNAQTMDSSNIQTAAVKPVTLDEAIKLAAQQASDFRQAQLNEKIVKEDITQAKAAFYPRVAVLPNLIYTSPSISKSAPVLLANGSFQQVARPPSFLGANAISEYQGLLNAAGEIDTSGRLRATLLRNQALLEAAQAGTQIARLALENTVGDIYFALSLATAKRRGAEQNLEAAREFERITKLLVDGGEVAPVDSVRARLQTAQRIDELEQAKTLEVTLGNALKSLIGIDLTQPISAADLNMQLPQIDEIQSISQTAIAARPEFAQFDAQQKSFEQEAKIARDERRPKFTYSISGGFISDSLLPNNLPKYLGVQANVGVTIPLFDHGASKSRQTQAELRRQIVENNRKLAERNFAEQFVSARLEAENAALRIRQIGASITDAEKNISASLARYQAGEAQVLEVTDAQNTLTVLRTALYQAIYDYQIARKRLLQAVGK